MKKLLVLATLILASVGSYAQIDMSDSTVQVIGYWSKDEKQSYKVSLEKFKIKEADTISRELITYDVDITVKDSTSDSYIVEWFYKNYEVETNNDLVKKLVSLGEEISVILKLNELGTVQEVVNWKEVRDNINKSTKILRKEFKGVPNAEKIIEQAMGIFQSKEAIEANAIKDVQQFYTFHGAKYTLGEELSGQLQLMNNFGGKPFDADLTVFLDEIDEEDGSSVMRMYQNVNSEQLTDATYAYLAKLGAMGNQLPPREKFPPLTNEIWTASRIHSGTGWILYSIETKHVKADGTTNVEERIIEMY